MNIPSRVEADDTGQGMIILRLAYGVGLDEMSIEIPLDSDQAKALAVELNSIFALRYRKEVEDLAAREKEAQTVRADDPLDPRDLA